MASRQKSADPEDLRFSAASRAPSEDSQSTASSSTVLFEPLCPGLAEAEGSTFRFFPLRNFGFSISLSIFLSSHFLSPLLLNGVPQSRSSTPLHSRPAPLVSPSPRLWSSPSLSVVAQLCTRVIGACLGGSQVLRVSV